MADQRECLGCGKAFEPRSTRHVWCSRPCYHHHRHRAEIGRRFAAGPKTRKCPGCGSQFRLKDTRQQATRHWCSYSCYRSAYNAHLSAVAFANGPSRRRCAGCKEYFRLQNPFQQKLKRYCSTACWRDYHRAPPRAEIPGPGQVGSDEWAARILGRVRTEMPRPYAGP